MKAMRQSADRRKAAFGRASFRAFRRWCFRGSCWKRRHFCRCLIWARRSPATRKFPLPAVWRKSCRSEYKRIEDALVRVLRSDRRVAQKILSAYLNLLTVYPDQPYDQKPILYPDSDVPIVEPENIGDADTLGEKEQRTLEIVRAAIQNRRACAHLHKLGAHGFPAEAQKAPDG